MNPHEYFLPIWTFCLLWTLKKICNYFSICWLYFLLHSFWRFLYKFKRNIISTNLIHIVTYSVGSFLLILFQKNVFIYDLLIRENLRKEVVDLFLNLNPIKRYRQAVLLIPTRRPKRNLYIHIFQNPIMNYYFQYFSFSTHKI